MPLQTWHLRQHRCLKQCDEHGIQSRFPLPASGVRHMLDHTRLDSDMLRRHQPEGVITR